MHYLNAIIGSLRVGASAPEPEALSAFPHLAALREQAPTFENSLDAHFEFGLGLVLDGLERLRTG